MLLRHFAGRSAGREVIDHEERILGRERLHLERVGRARPRRRKMACVELGAIMLLSHGGDGGLPRSGGADEVD